MGPLLRVDGDDNQKVVGHILFLTQARKVDGSNSNAQPTAVMFLSIEDEDKSFGGATDDLVKVLNQVATSCKGAWQFSVPTFVN